MHPFYHNIEAVVAYGGLNTGYTFIADDFSTQSDGMIDVIYRSWSSNCDPFLHSNADIPYEFPSPPFPEGTHAGELISVDTAGVDEDPDDAVAYEDYPPENEPTLHYQTAQCEMNLDKTDPDSFSACPWVLDPGGGPM